jgi:hypothetical protein
MQFLDLSGFMFSGKAAVHDLISEIDGIWTPGNRIEFDLLRVKDGVADLENAISSWSPIRSDAAVRRFLGVVRKMSARNKGLNRLFVPGFDYGQRYPNLIEATDKMVRDITKAEWPMFWPYHLLEMSPIEIAWFKIIRKFKTTSNNTNYRLISGDKFIERLREYLEEILTYRIDDKKYNTIVTNNAFEPFNPHRFINYFHDARCIVVDRDPRDIYATANQYSTGFNDQLQIYNRIAGAFDVNTFIDRISVYRSNISQVASDRILFINFEDLIYNYEIVVNRIYNFLGISPEKHSKKFSKFDPEKSKKNIGLWRSLPDQDSIKLIEQALFA